MGAVLAELVALLLELTLRVTELMCVLTPTCWGGGCGGSGGAVLYDSGLKLKEERAGGPAPPPPGFDVGWLIVVEKALSTWSSSSSSRTRK